MAERTLYQKLGIAPGMRSLFINAPEEFHVAIAAGNANIESELSGEFAYIHLFVENMKQFSTKFPIAKKHLRPFGMLWVSWPKAKKSQIGADINLFKIIELGYEFGLVESKVVSVDKKWSAIKFTHPKAGKTYQNSYGKLKQESKR